MDAVLCDEVRKLLKNGYTIPETTERLQSRYPASDIKDAIDDFYHDEATDYDDKLVKQIEKRLSKGDSRKGELLQDIYADLVKKGHKPFEIEKALLRAKVNKRFDIAEIFMKWTIYSMIQVGILLTTVLLGLFYEWMFLFASIFILIEMIMASANIPRENGMWRQRITVLPFGGLVVTDGIFGYNSRMGNYWRWWIMDPAQALSGFFLIFAMVAGGYYGLFEGVEYGMMIAVISLFLAGFSYVSFSMKPQDKSRPPYDI